MRVAYDVSPLSLPLAGVGTYLHGALGGMVEAGARDIVAFGLAGSVAPIDAALGELAVERRIWARPGARLWRSAWQTLRWPTAESVLGRFDVLHVTHWLAPPQRSGARATMVHDLVPQRFPEWVHPHTKRMHDAHLRDVRRCEVVFVNAEFTKRDLVERAGVREERVRVAYPGIDPGFIPGDVPADGYVLTVATLEPRKNLGTLLRAPRPHGLELVVAGGPGWGPQAELGRPGVRALGYVPHDELPALYRGAAVFVYPSRFEGFGIPVIEAMACGVPCVVSSHPSLDEACGDAAVRADPDDSEAFGAAIEDALARREELVPKGLAHARPFTWRACGEAHLAGYREAL